MISVFFYDIRLANLQKKIDKYEKKNEAYFIFLFIIFLNSSPINVLRYSLSEFAKKIDNITLIIQ